ncbi:hypothetical protein BT93_A0666 [Corymbia citriodora subsp. variegata]|nr:hypothetical protein BT93_A0666 [Corymbia citriodora subsp. variegata]
MRSGLTVHPSSRWKPEKGKSNSSPKTNKLQTLPHSLSISLSHPWRKAEPSSSIRRPTTGPRRRSPDSDRPCPPRSGIGAAPESPPKCGLGHHRPHAATIVPALPSPADRIAPAPAPAPAAARRGLWRWRRPDPMVAAARRSLLPPAHAAAAAAASSPSDRRSLLLSLALLLWWS